MREPERSPRQDTFLVDHLLQRRCRFHPVLSLQVKRRAVSEGGSVQPSPSELCQRFHSVKNTTALKGTADTHQTRARAYGTTCLYFLLDVWIK